MVISGLVDKKDHFIQCSMFERVVEVSSWNVKLATPADFQMSFDIKETCIFS